MLGMVVEQVTGHPIAGEVRARILETVGLASTYYPVMPNMPQPYAHGYGFDPLEDVTRSKVSNRLNTSNGQSCDVERVASQRLVSPVRASRQFQ
jgi:CubicO group peptidase (beta-lactamase class C family)